MTYQAREPVIGTIQWQDIGKGSGYHERHGAFIRPGYRGVGVVSGIGDYCEWLENEAADANAEALRERQERFEGREATLPAVEPVTPAEEPERTPVADAWYDRWAIDMRLRDQGANDDEIQEAINCTMFARRFEGWIADGAQQRKGRNEYRTSKTAKAGTDYQDPDAAPAVHDGVD